MNLVRLGMLLAAFLAGMLLLSLAMRLQTQQASSLELQSLLDALESIHENTSAPIEVSCQFVILIRNKAC